VRPGDRKDSTEIAVYGETARSQTFSEPINRKVGFWESLSASLRSS
jgi:hypothetical protein